MKAAPGAQLAIKDIFGRDPFIAGLWKVLEQNSVQMVAERRVGKTSILNKMAAEPPANWEPIPFDLEQVHSAAEFAELVSQKIHNKLTGWKRQGRRLWDLLRWTSGTQFGPIKFPDKKAHPDGYWKNLLTRAVEDLTEQQTAAGKRVVFLFDELPWMLSAIADPQRDGEQTAMEVLDLLRSLRQSTTTGSGFRMVLCGSIGLHHVLGALKESGYRNQPVNDMMLIDVPALDPGTATDLARQLLIGEGLTAHANAAEIIAEQTGGFPFYIHWVVSELSKKDNKGIAPADVQRTVTTLLTAPHDPCNFRNYRDRIDGYYPKDQKAVLAILDHAAVAPLPISVAELIHVVKSVIAVEDEAVRKLLRLLSVDHYLARDEGGNYLFRHPLIRRWWILERGLPS